MDRGHALQIGTPEAIYRRPASRQVAAFFGAPNLLEARVTACHPHGPDAFRLAVEGEGWHGECRAAEPYRPAEPVTVLVRPENVALNPGGSTPGAIAWRGKVTETVFRGPRLSLKVATTARTIQVEATALCGVRVGDTVDARCRAGGGLGDQAVKIDECLRTAPLTGSPPERRPRPADCRRNSERSHMTPSFRSGRWPVAS